MFGSGRNDGATCLVPCSPGRAGPLNVSKRCSSLSAAALLLRPRRARVDEGAGELTKRAASNREVGPGCALAASREIPREIPRELAALLELLLECGRPERLAITLWQPGISGIFRRD